MGSLCSKESNSIQDCVASDNEKAKEASNPSKKDEIVVGLANGSVKESSHTITKPLMQQTMSSVKSKDDEDNKKDRIVERPVSGHKRRNTLDLGGNNNGGMLLGRIISASEEEQTAAGWPTWLSSVAGEAIQGWVPRSADSFQKLGKIGQGTYSSVYKARDLKSNKIVAMKKVRFVNMDPESVRFMAREINILRKLDHPNVMKLEALVTSRMSGSLYLVFEYMEHDLAGLAASSKVKFTESQIKCYMQQLLRGLEYCHSRGVLHRDIKGSNLLVDNNGILKIGDFGLATFFQQDQQQPLTSRVVTLWYRAPELLLGATEYGVAIDLWSVGCILAELFAGKPIMPGRTEVEQMHKIFKLCGSPSEDYWKRSKLPHATSFKPQHPYPRRVSEAFKEFPSSALALVDVLLSMNPEQRGTAASALNSEFFTTKPLACEPSSLPIYPPSKEFDVKLQQEEAKRKKAESVKGRGSETARRDSRQSKEVPTPEFEPQAQGQSNTKSTSEKYNPQDDVGSGFLLEPPRVPEKKITHSNSMIHPIAAASLSKKSKEDLSVGSVRLSVSSTKRANLTRQTSQIPDSVNSYSTKHHRTSSKDSMGTLPNIRRIHYSGPLMPPGGNMEDMLKEHERQIQDAVRKARVDKERTKKNCHNHNTFHY